MKLDYLWVENFKNLNGFKADFDENPEELFTILLGQNGLGKSNLLEALVVIFRDLFRGVQTEFGYELRYTLNRGETKISCGISRRRNLGRAGSVLRSHIKMAPYQKSVAMNSRTKKVANGCQGMYLLITQAPVTGWRSTFVRSKSSSIAIY